MAQLIDDYILYQTEQLFDYRFRSYQIIAGKKIIRSLVNSEMEEIPLNWARQVGKTDLIKIMFTIAVFFPFMGASRAWTDIYPDLARFKDGVRGAIIAPVEWQAKNALERITQPLELNPKIKYYLKTQFPKKIEITKNNTKQLSLSNGSGIDIHTAATGCGKPGNTYHWLWGTEAQLLSAYAVRSVFSPTLSSTQGTKIFDGTAESFRNDFWQVIQRESRRRPNDKSITIPYDRAGREIPGYIDYVDKELTNIPGGKESPFFRLNYMLEWVGAGANLISWDVFNTCIADGQNGRPLFMRGQIDRQARHRYFGGVDHAKVKDYTVATLAEAWNDHLRVTDWLELPRGIAYPEQAEILANWYKAKKLPPMSLSILSDATGPGDMPTDALISNLRGYAQVGAMKFSASSKDYMYLSFNKLIPASATSKTKSLLYWPANDQSKELINFEQQMLDCQLGQHGNYFTWAAPEQQGIELNAENHDDYCASLLLTTAAYDCGTNYGTRLV